MAAAPSSSSSSALPSTLNHDGMMLLEAPFARVPHDELRSYLRTQQRFVERDLTFCSTTLDTLAKSARTTGLATAAVSSSKVVPTAYSGHSTPHVERTADSSGLTSRDAADDEQADMSAVDASLLADVSFAASESNIDGNSLLGGDTSLTTGSGDVPGTPSKTLTLENKTGNELDRSLDLMIGRIKGLKRKLAQVHESTGSTLTRLEARTTHLDDVHRIPNTSSPAFDEWCRTRLDRMLVDWMLRKGFAKSAELLAKNRKIENYVDLNLFAEIARIEASLIGTMMTASDEGSDGKEGARQRSCVPSLAWCSENKAALRKIRSTLEFDLRLQEYIELTRMRTPQSLQEAIVYSRRYLLPHLVPSTAQQQQAAMGKEDASANGNGVQQQQQKSRSDDKEEREEREQQDSIRRQVARAMGLLACGPKGWAYDDLYSDERWQTLRTTFRSAALQIHSLPPQPLLHIALSAGLSSLKLPACYVDENGQGDVAPPAHLGGRAFGDEQSNLLSVVGVTSTSVSAPPTFPPAAGIPASGLALDPPYRALSPPQIRAGSTANDTTAISSSPSSNVHGAHVKSHTKNDNCPVCDAKGLGILAKEVPWSHHANSTLVCSISGRMMDENDPPMALPNGRVYSLTALQEMASNSHDSSTIVCPRTGSAYKLNQLRKVYIS